MSRLQFHTLKAIPIAFMCSLLIFQNVAHAASVYDNAYKTTDDMVINGNGCTDGVHVTSLPELTNLWTDSLLWQDGDQFDYGQDFWEQNFNNDHQSLSVAVVDDGSHKEIEISGSKVGAADDNYELQWYHENVYDTSGVYLKTKDNSTNLNKFRIRTINSDCEVEIYKVGGVSSGNYNNIIASFSNLQYVSFLLQVAPADINYPEDYEGLPIKNDFTEPQTLAPEYSWSVDTNGKLTIKYLKNINPFLTGISTLKVDKTGDNWVGIDSNIAIEAYNPAGWAEWSVDLPDHGYYRFDISHNQQLDNPPWENASSYRIGQVWVEIWWNGQAIAGGTSGCVDSSICNDFKDTTSKYERQASSIFSLDTGLSSILLIPIDFVTGLPGRVGNCTPITLQLIGQNITWPCLSTIFYNQSWFATIWTIWQTIVTAAVAYWVAVASLGTIQSLVKPHDDRIEVTQL